MLITSDKAVKVWKTAFKKETPWQVKKLSTDASIAWQVKGHNDLADVGCWVGVVTPCWIEGAQVRSRTSHGVLACNVQGTSRLLLSPSSKLPMSCHQISHQLVYASFKHLQVIFTVNSHKYSYNFKEKIYFIYMLGQTCSILFLTPKLLTLYGMSQKMSCSLSNIILYNINSSK